jgi:YVTN family beta-propeller protein
MQGASVQRIDRKDGNIIADIPVGPYPAHGLLGICSGAGKIWVADAPVGQVVCIDPKTNSITAKVAVGKAPRHVCFDGIYVWVTNSEDGTVGKINPLTFEQGTTVASGHNPYRMAFDGRYVWVGNFDDNTISKIDPVNDEKMATITVGKQPWGVFYDGSYVWVSNYGEASISMIDPIKDEVLGFFNLEPNAGPHDMVVIRNELWVTNSSTNHIQCLDIFTGAIIRTINVGNDPAGMCFDGMDIWNCCAMSNVILRHKIN